MIAEEREKNYRFYLGDLFRNTSTGIELQIFVEGSDVKIPSNQIVTPVDLNLELAQKIAGSIGLTFISENLSTGNVCMAESESVRPEFREICTGDDLLRYLVAIVSSYENFEKFRKREIINFRLLSFPKNAEAFWAQVEAGSKLKMKIYKLP